MNAYQSEDVPQDIDQALRFIKGGGVVALPTDTLYGLGADVFSLPALERIFAIKKRPTGLALPVLVCCWDQVHLVAKDVPEAAHRLAVRFWPGALTLILPGLEGLPKLITGARDTVAVRMPDHPVPQALARGLGRPITGTSANRSGAQDLQALDAVEAELGGDIDYIIRAGPIPGGTPSTVIDATQSPPRLVRQGALLFNKILDIWG